MFKEAEMMQKERKSKHGFTLIELVIVIIIIGILASLAIPSYFKTVERSRISEALSALGSIRAAQFRYASEHGKYADDFGDLDINISKGKYFTFEPLGDGNALDNAYTDAVAQASRIDGVDGGSYTKQTGCDPYAINITEGGNFTSPCGPLNDILK